MLSGNNDKNSKEIPSIVLNGIKNIPENYSLPKLHGSECFKATLIRLAIPGVFIAICLLIITTAPAQSDSTVLQGWIAFAIVFAIWWVAHWYFAKWKNANKQNNPTPYPRAFITLGKGISALILFYLFTIFLELLSLYRRYLKPHYLDLRFELGYYVEIRHATCYSLYGNSACL